MSANYPAILFMHAMHDTCALHCLLAIHIGGPLPLTQQAIMEITSFDDVAVHKGLGKLLALGLVTCTGQKHRSAWQLSSAAHALPLPFNWSPAATLDSAESAPGPVIEEENKDTDTVLDTDSSPRGVPDPEPVAAGAPEPTSAEPPPESALPGDALGLDDPFATDPSAQSPAPAGASEPSSAPPNTLTATHPHTQTPASTALRSHFYAAFEEAGIWLQLRRPLADALLAEDGPLWLAHTLGWICYGARRLPHLQRGAVVYISLRDRLPCDSACLPPPELPFAEALAWAARGGETETPPGPEPEPDSAAPPPAAPPPSPEELLWQTALDRLGHELPRRVLTGYLSEARLVSLAEGRCLIAAATPQARDWLRNRLASALARALSQAAGRELSVEIV